MTIANIVSHLESLAPLTYQESYDNAGLICGNREWQCTGILCSLDATEDVVNEAIQLGYNLVVAHHPIVFSGLKKITGSGNYVEKTIIAAIKNDVAIYAIHTNLDNVIDGVNGKIADKLGLVKRRVLAERPNSLNKLVVFVPVEHAEKVRTAIFNTGGGSLGDYSECSFNVDGKGTFKAGENAHPFVGEIGKRHQEDEVRIEIIFPAYRQQAILGAMKAAHPYEVVAYDVYPLLNNQHTLGSGLVGELENEMEESAFLQKLREVFGLKVIKHTSFTGKQIKTVALCGGAGSFLTKTAIAAGADVYVTGDVKYHEFFDAEGKLLLADIGHWESEQFTSDLLVDVLGTKFPTFAVQKSKVQTNPVQYFI